MKDYIERQYRDEPKEPTYNKLHSWVKEAWDILPDSFWQEQLASMPSRM